MQVDIIPRAAERKFVGYASTAKVMIELKLMLTKNLPRIPNKMRTILVVVEAFEVKATKKVRKPEIVSGADTAFFLPNRSQKTVASELAGKSTMLIKTKFKDNDPVPRLPEAKESP